MDSIGGTQMAYECFHCGERAVYWNADFSFEDYGLEGEGIIHHCTCSNCGAEIEYYIDLNEDKEGEDKMEVANEIVMGMEKKLIELMGVKDYNKFSTELAKKAFRNEVEGMKDGDFKQFVLDNFEKITDDASLPFEPKIVASFEEREWIDPWNDRRPMTDDWVLVTANDRDHRFVTLGRCEDDEWYYFDEDTEVLAWMPLPDVYVDDGKSKFGEEWTRQ